MGKYLEFSKNESTLSLEEIHQLLTSAKISLDTERKKMRRSFGDLAEKDGESPAPETERAPKRSRVDSGLSRTPSWQGRGTDGQGPDGKGNYKVKAEPTSAPATIQGPRARSDNLTRALEAAGEDVDRFLASPKQRLASNSAPTTPYMAPYFKPDPLRAKTPDLDGKEKSKEKSPSSSQVREKLFQSKDLFRAKEKAREKEAEGEVDSMDVEPDEDLSTSGSQHRRCYICKATRSLDGQILQVCSACETVSYCCPEHQKEDWSRHRVDCKAHRNQKK